MILIGKTLCSWLVVIAALLSKASANHDGDSRYDSACYTPDPSGVSTHIRSSLQCGHCAHYSESCRGAGSVFFRLKEECLAEGGQSFYDVEKGLADGTYCYRLSDNAIMGLCYTCGSCCGDGTDRSEEECRSNPTNRSWRPHGHGECRVFSTPPPLPPPTDKPVAPPTASPTAVPTTSPTMVPTAAPTSSPTQAPTDAPTRDPTEMPTTAPPTAMPTSSPSVSPTAAPTPSPTGLRRNVEAPSVEEKCTNPILGLLNSIFGWFFALWGIDLCP